MVADGELAEEKDDAIERGQDVLARHRVSVASGRDLAQVAAADAAAGSKPGCGTRAQAATPGPRTPAFVAPARATSAERSPTGADWIFEVKRDGYRLLVALDEHAAVRVDLAGAARARRLALRGARGQRLRCS